MTVLYMSGGILTVDIGSLDVDAAVGLGCLLTAAQLQQLRVLQSELTLPSRLACQAQLQCQTSGQLPICNAHI